MQRLLLLLPSKPAPNPWPTSLEDDPYAALTIWKVCSLQATSIRPLAARFLQIPCPLTSTQVALFKPGQLADDLMATISISKGRYLMLAVKNLSVHPFTLAAGVLLVHAQAVALARGYIRMVGDAQASTRLFPEIHDDLPQDQQDLIATLLLEYQDVFSQADDDIGQTHLVEHTIHM